MVEALMKICGALFVGGIGLLLILICTMIAIIIIKESVQRIKEKNNG
jgi:hypothetical protein